MAKGEFGFVYGAPENLDKTWEKEISGLTFIFKKARQKSGVFLYNCSCHKDFGSMTSASSTGFYGERSITPAEVETAPQFSSFISNCVRSATLILAQIQEQQSLRRAFR